MPRRKTFTQNPTPVAQEVSEAKEQDFNIAIGSEPKVPRMEVQKAITLEVFTESFIAEMERIMRLDNVNQAELARRLGCSPSNITQIMKYSSNLNAATMANIATALDHRIVVRFKPVR